MMGGGGAFPCVPNDRERYALPTNCATSGSGFSFVEKRKIGRGLSCNQSKIEKGFHVTKKEKPMSQQPMIYYAVTQERGEHWDARRSMREQEKWEEHARFMDALVDDGFVVLGGPLDDAEKVLLIINAESEQAIHARLAEDPWTPMGIRRIANVARWEILLRASQ